MSAPPRANTTRAPQVWKRVLRPVAAVALLALVVWFAGPRQLLDKLAAIDVRFFAAAVLVGICSNVVSALRWGTLARALDLRAPRLPLLSAYAQGIAVNLVVPGATLGGDALRALRLTQLGNPAGASALSVLLDRASGLWVLCVLSLVATAAWWLFGSSTAAAHALPPVALALYVAGLFAAVTAPWWPLHLRGTYTGWRARLATAWQGWHEQVIACRDALVRSIWASLAVQVLSATTLYLCARAAGGSVDYASVLIVAAPIFVAAALPMSISGFGPRELAATVAFAAVGASAAEGATAAALYGVTAVVQGVLGAPLLALDARSR